MGLMLLGLSAIYAFLGNRTDSLILLIAWVPVTAVDVVLGIRADSAIRALRSTLNPRAKALRDGAIAEVPARELVPGDVLVFEEGQALPADGRVLESENL